MIYMRPWGMPHIFEKLFIKATTFLENLLQSEVYTRSYGRPKWWEFQFWEFQDSRLGKNAIWV
jgi:hypothetical protein